MYFVIGLAELLAVYQLIYTASSKNQDGKTGKKGKRFLKNYSLNWQKYSAKRFKGCQMHLLWKKSLHKMFLGINSERKKSTKAENFLKHV